VESILEQYPQLDFALAHACDEGERQAINIAGPLCQTIIKHNMLLLKRFNVITTDAPHHKSATCIVHIGIDEGSKKEREFTIAKCALKFMKNRDQFLREISSRQQGDFDKEFVLSINNVFDSDADPKVLADLTRRGFGDHKYLIEMEAGSRNLNDIISSEQLCEDPDQVKFTILKLMKCVQHMHDKGFIHGDLKPKNIMRIGANIKLIDLDGETQLTLNFVKSMSISSLCFVFPLTVCFRCSVACSHRPDRKRIFRSEDELCVFSP
jgi:serine/threonine protein kinase